MLFPTQLVLKNLGGPKFWSPTILEPQNFGAPKSKEYPKICPPNCRRNTENPKSGLEFSRRDSPLEFRHDFSFSVILRQFGGNILGHVLFFLCKLNQLGRFCLCCRLSLRSASGSTATNCPSSEQKLRRPRGKLMGNPIAKLALNSCEPQELPRLLHQHAGAAQILMMLSWQMLKLAKLHDQFFHGDR